MATGEMTAKAVEELSLQAKFDQLSGQIEEAHKILDRISPREGDESPPI